MYTKMAETARNDTADLIPTPVITRPADSVSLEQPSCHTVVIGNISGANLLTCAVMNKQGPLQIPPSAADMLHRDNGNILPLKPTQEVKNQQNQSQNESELAIAIDSSSSSGLFQGLHKHKALEAQNELCESSGTVSESENYRAQLTSSDTIILSPESLCVSDSLPISSLMISASNDAEQILSKDKAVLPNLDKPFSLLRNISDRSVSLESIPSTGLFQLDRDHSSSFSLYKSDSEETTSGSSKAISEKIFSEITDGHTISETTVLRSNRIPEPVMLLMKHLQHAKSPHQKICLLTSLGKVNSNTSIPDQAGNDRHQSSSLPASRMKETPEERNSDTNTEMQSETVSTVKNQAHDLSRSDTVILNVVHKDSKAGGLSSDLRSADTFVLACDDKQVHSNEKSSEGFSFTSLNCSGLSSLELQTDQPVIHKSPSILCSSLVNLSEPLPVLGFQNDNVNKSLYIVTNEGYLAAVKYVSPDPVDVSQLVHLGLFSNVDVNHPIFSPAGPETHSRKMEAKETQTELVFGTNMLQFKLVDAELDSTCSLHHLDSLNFSNPLQEKPALIPSVIVISGHSTPPGQPQETVISLAKPTGSDKTAPQNQIAVKQLTECGSTPHQAAESGLPEVSHANSSGEFKCMECQDTFETKNDLVSHENTHKRGFKCDLCNATFTRIGNFTRHRKIHKLETESQNMFKCSDCGREFLQRCDLKRHLLIHAKQEPHRCEKCGKGYIRHSDLVVHMRFHNKDKAFKCSMCEKKFFQTGDLNRHFRRVHVPNSHMTCGHCNRKYACESTLIRHMKAAHKDIILLTANAVSQNLQESSSSTAKPGI